MAVRKTKLQQRRDVYKKLHPKVGDYFLKCLDKLKCTLVETWNNEYFTELYVVENLLDPYKFDIEGYTENFEFLDPQSQSIVDRSVAGYSTYHLNPYDHFFKLDSLVPPNKKINPDFEASLQYREEAIHSVMQEAYNFSQTSLQVRDKVLGGLSGSVLEKSGTLGVVETRIPVRDLAMGSCHGRVLDIFGFREGVTLYQLSRRYPEVEDPELQEWLNTGSPLKQDEDKICVYRFNMVKKELYAYLKRDLVDMAGMMTMGEFDDYFTAVFGGMKREDYWCDFTWCDRGILYVDENKYKNIIISNYQTPPTAMSLSVGCGRRAIGLISLMAELPSINFQTFEKTFAPGYVVPDGASAAKLNTDQWGVSFVEDPSLFRDTSLRSDIGGLISFDRYYYEKLKESFNLDVFELLRQTHMTKPEVSQRIADSARKLGPYLIEDERTGLVPRVLFINEQLQKKEPIPELEKSPLVARYRSTLASAQRDGVFQENQRVVEQLVNLAKLNKESNFFREVLDFKNQAINLVSTAGLRHFLLSEEEMKVMSELAREKERVEMAMQEQKLLEGELGNEQAEQRLNAPEAQ